MKTSGSLALAAGEAVARLVAFATTVHVARTLGPELYGVVAVAAGVMLYLNQATDHGIELVGIQEASGGPRRVSGVLRPLLSLRLRGAVLLLVLTAIATRVALPAPDGTVLLLFALGLPLTAVSLRWVYVGLQRPGAVSAARIAGDVITAVLVLTLVRGPGDVQRYPVAVVVGLTVATAVMFGRFPSLGIPKGPAADAEDVAGIARRGRQLATFTLLGLVLYNVDLLLIRWLRGEADSGQYAAAYVLISFCVNLIVAWAHTILPAIAREPANLTSSPVYSRALSLAWAATIPITIGGFLVADALLPMLFGASYRPAADTLQLLLLSLPLAALREVGTAALIARQQEPALLRVNLVATVINVGLNLVLIPRYALAGAAVATVLSELIRLVIVLGEADRTTHASRAVRPILLSTLVAGVMGIAVLAVRDASPLLAVGAGGVIYLAGLMLVGLLRVGRGGRPAWNSR